MGGEEKEKIEDKTLGQSSGTAIQDEIGSFMGIGDRTGRESEDRVSTDGEENLDGIQTEEELEAEDVQDGPDIPAPDLPTQAELDAQEREERERQEAETDDDGMDEEGESEEEGDEEGEEEGESSEGGEEEDGAESEAGALPEEESGEVSDEGTLAELNRLAQSALKATGILTGTAQTDTPAPPPKQSQAPVQADGSTLELTEDQIDEFTSDPGKLRAHLADIEAESFKRGSNQGFIQARHKFLSEDFFRRNEDLAPYAHLVVQRTLSIQTENPTMDMAEALMIVEKELKPRAGREAKKAAARKASTSGKRVKKQSKGKTRRPTLARPSSARRGGKGATASKKTGDSIASQINRWKDDFSPE